MAFPATYNINYFSGDLFQIGIVPKTAAGDLYGITSGTYDGYFRISTERNGAASATVDGEISIGTNLVTFSITPDVSDNLTPGTTYYYDVTVQNKTNSDQTFTLLTGAISISPRITPSS